MKRAIFDGDFGCGLAVCVLILTLGGCFVLDKKWEHEEKMQQLQERK